jgi:pyridoxal phosphate enzyme (YggS family)
MLYFKTAGRQLIMTTISANLQAVRERIDAAARQCGRDAGEIALVAVGKTRTPEELRAAASAGQRRFAENYVQEGVAKANALSDLALEWHFIGPLQSNKTRPVAEHFAWVHSVDRLRVAERLSEQRPTELPPLQLCLQVNVSSEETKSGVAPAELGALAHAVAALPRIRLRGLMAIPAPAAEFAQQRQAFRCLRLAFEELQAQGLKLDTLSMGMTDDLEAAIFEGATLVRVGTAIFGERSKT